MDLGYNMLGEGLGSLFHAAGKIKNRGYAATVDTLKDGARYLDDVVEGATRNDIGYMKNNSDPMRDVLGSGRNSNPEEWSSIIQDLKNGVEIRYREGNMMVLRGN